MKVANSYLALSAAILTAILGSPSQGSVVQTAPAHATLPGEASTPRCNIALTVTEHRDEAIVDITRYHALRDRRRSTFETQLRAFVERRREAHTAMTMSKVHGLSPGLQTALAAHFRELNPAPFGGAPKQLRDTGKDIYEAGNSRRQCPCMPGLSWSGGQGRLGEFLV